MGGSPINFCPRPKSKADVWVVGIGRARPVTPHWKPSVLCGDRLRRARYSRELSRQFVVPAHRMTCRWCRAPKSAIIERLGARSLAGGPSEVGKYHREAIRMAFVLRFVEPCVLASTSAASAGTMTNTFVRAEDSDADPRVHDHRIVPRGASSRHGARFNPVLTATSTQTEVHREGPDNDPVGPRFNALPKEDDR